MRRSLRNKFLCRLSLFPWNVSGVLSVLTLATYHTLEQRVATCYTIWINSVVIVKSDSDYYYFFLLCHPDQFVKTLILWAGSKCQLLLLFVLLLWSLQCVDIVLPVWLMYRERSGENQFLMWSLTFELLKSMNTETIKETENLVFF